MIESVRRDTDDQALDRFGIVLPKWRVSPSDDGWLHDLSPGAFAEDAHSQRSPQGSRPPAAPQLRSCLNERERTDPACDFNFALLSPWMGRYNASQQGLCL
jgi:hypothetical protein